MFAPLGPRYSVTLETKRCVGYTLLVPPETLSHLAISTNSALGKWAILYVGMLRPKSMRYCDLEGAYFCDYKFSQN